MIKLNHSQQSIINELKFGEAKTRKELCELTDFSWAAISKTTAQLQSLGLVASEDEKRVTKHGRRPTRIHLNPNSYMVGIVIRKVKIEVALFSLNHELKEYLECDLNNDDDILPLTVMLLKKLLVKDIISKVIAIGISFPALIESNKKYIINSMQFPEYDSRPFGEEIKLAMKLKIPLFVERNAVCDLIYLLLTREIKRDTLLVAMTEGVSAAVYIDGNILHGNSGNIGEFGHLVNSSSKRACVCGKFGCIETEVGELAWKRKYDQLSDSERKYSSFIEAVNHNDKAALTIIKDSIQYFYPILGHLTILLKPNNLAFSTNLPKSTALIIATEIERLSQKANIQDRPKLLMPDKMTSVGGAALLPLLWLSGNSKYSR